MSSIFPFRTQKEIQNNEQFTELMEWSKLQTCMKKPRWSYTSTSTLQEIPATNFNPSVGQVWLILFSLLIDNTLNTEEYV